MQNKRIVKALPRVNVPLQVHDFRVYKADLQKQASLALGNLFFDWLSCILFPKNHTKISAKIKNARFNIRS